jgi:hypothetical protein
MIRRLVAASSAALLLASIGVSAVAAGGPPKVGFYVDDHLYRTVGTPTDFSGTGAPASSYDHIYALGDGLMNVADAKPGDRDFNGGRWMVYAVTWTEGVTPVQLTNDGAVLKAAQDGKLTIDWTPVKMFECPVIPLGGHR